MTTSYTPDQQRRILSIARNAVADVLSYREPGDPRVTDKESFLQQPYGCFVTLHHRHGQLRGCIGNFSSEDPLWITVIKMAAAATRDPRFVRTNPVVLAEINDLVIEVSMLTPLQRIDDPMQMKLGEDGIYIVDTSSTSHKTGCFLPQVATEQGWNLEETLSNCCAHKMGLAADAWRTRSDLEFYTFQSTIIRETDLSA